MVHEACVKDLPDIKTGWNKIKAMRIHIHYFEMERWKRKNHDLKKQLIKLQCGLNERVCHALFVKDCWQDMAHKKIDSMQGYRVIRFVFVFVA